MGHWFGCCDELDDGLRVFSVSDSGRFWLVRILCFGVNDTKQNLIPPGIYTTKGYDISNYPSNTNLPKQIFYGTYKMNYTKKSGRVVGCFIFVIEIKRPFELE
ncbi:uncharacterized protein LOC111040154 [Myzus persicae]|uniref:uncharacterized protein LOC111040154 n=1 Tax=Myzus persicae TaxID=13164 RepID=UPI000B93417F|nr:uncharacterized protein LOC111040154 [Myzus persicae]